ncbi:hypothetical protein [Microcoleus vaginatus]
MQKNYIAVAIATEQKLNFPVAPLTLKLELAKVLANRTRPASLL